jgi:hypothetical protein
LALLSKCEFDATLSPSSVTLSSLAVESFSKGIFVLSLRN